MIRRDFIKVMAAGGCYMVAPALLGGCSSSGQSDQKPVVTDQSDIRLTLISHAMLAPNSHNIQPWLIRLRGKDSMQLYVDRDRLLPHTDPPARQIHISQGTFLETLQIAGAEFGYQCNIDYFPQGMYSNLETLDSPVAEIHLKSDSAAAKSGYFPYLRQRQSNKRSYDNKPLTKSRADAIAVAGTGSGFRTVVSDDPVLKTDLAAMLGESMAIETANPLRHKETVDLFRFSEKEAETYRDGFTVANNGMTGITRFFVESFFLGSKEQAYNIESSFAEEGVKMAYRQAESAAAFGWLISETNTRLDQVMIGHLYMKLNLLTTKLGVEMHPMSQVLEEYDDMRELQTRFKKLIGVPENHTVQMLFRLGYAAPVPQTKRRRTEDILV